MEALVRTAADTAAEQAAAAWRGDPAGAELLGTDADLQHSSPGLADATTRTVRDWQAGVLELVRDQGQGKRVDRPLPRVRRQRARADGDGRRVRSHGRADRRRGRRRRWGDGAEPEDPRGGARRPGRAQRWPTRLAPTCTAGSPTCWTAERRRFTDRLDAAGVHEGAGAALRAAVQDVEEVR